MPNYKPRMALCFALAACASTQVAAAPCVRAQKDSFLPNTPARTRNS